MTDTVTKWLYLKLDDGRVYRINAHLLAHDYATYFSDPNGFDDTESYDVEYAACIASLDNLEDWAVGEMDWWTLAEYVTTDYIDPQACYIVDSWLEDGDN